MDSLENTREAEGLRETAGWGLRKRAALRWYVLRTKPNAEGQVLQELERQGVASFCPMILEYRWRRRRREKTPLFPGYVFARFAYPDQYDRVRWLRGVNRLVRFGDCDPPYVGDEVITFFIQQVNDMGVLEISRYFSPGDRVKFVTDPFRGLMGRIVRADSAKRRVVVLMDILYQATVEADAGQVIAL